MPSVMVFVRFHGYRTPRAIRPSICREPAPLAAPSFATEPFCIKANPAPSKGCWSEGSVFGGRSEAYTLLHNNIIIYTGYQFLFQCNRTPSMPANIFHFRGRVET